jgi:5,10-methenyltetrahydrofolate synthetase
MTDKKTLRSEYKKIRAGLGAEHRATAAHTITERVLELEEVKQADNVLVFVSTGTEVATEELTDRLLAAGKRVAVPKTMDTPSDMLFFYINGREELQLGKYNIYEPQYNSDKLCKTNSSTVIIVPGLAFDHSLARLGYGGGYYDKYMSLNEYKAAVGVCYDEQLMDEECIKCDSNDIRLDIIVSDKRVIKRKTEA